MATAQKFLAEARHRLTDQPRLRIGVWIIGLVLVINGALMISDAKENLLPELQRLANRQVQIQQIVADGDWTARAAAARNQVQTIEQRFWSAPSEGLARAEFQNMLEQTAQSIGMEAYDVELRSFVQIEQMPGLFRLGGTVEALNEPAKLVFFLAALSDAESYVGVEGVRFGDIRNRRASIDVSAVFRLNLDELGS